ncbi:helix-turn-helix domain-containing protein [Anaeromicropila herbilytica]|uniref:Transcriptional regulator n=1 Tax=Anaeromicropila herbilytica TaxID=2785025 RepID=A0A7R7EHC0_9FIRM|nr:helix-turn-helix domain-containing protein [Anaeromicropila herbilytica]BCN28841.1 transcriptional regulator [Anaeromicropila herbilytica]
MNTFKVGDVIRKTRLGLKITQEQLSDGICSVGSLSKIENNLQVPTKANFDALMQRMGKTGDIYYSFVSERDFDIQEMKHRITLFMSVRQYEEARKILMEFEKLVDKKEVLNIQFILYIKAIIDKNNGESLEHVLDLFLQAIKITIPNFNVNRLSNYLLTDEDIMIINNIALAYYNLDNKEEAIKLMYELIDYIEDRYIDTKSKVEKLPLILYNLSKWLGLEKRYEEAIDICNKGVEVCNKHGKLRCYGEIIYNKGYNLYELDRREESIDCIKQAYYIFLAQQNTEYASNVVAFAKENLNLNLEL